MQCILRGLVCKYVFYVVHIIFYMVTCSSIVMTIHLFFSGNWKDMDYCSIVNSHGSIFVMFTLELRIQDTSTTTTLVPYLIQTEFRHLTLLLSVVDLPHICGL